MNKGWRGWVGQGGTELVHEPTWPSAKFPVPSFRIQPTHSEHVYKHKFILREVYLKEVKWKDCLLPHLPTQRLRSSSEQWRRKGWWRGRSAQGDKMAPDSPWL